MRAEEMLVGQLPEERGIIGLGELRSRRAEPEVLMRPILPPRCTRPSKRPASSSRSAASPDAGRGPWASEGRTHQ
jgi:hypothetical protein